MATADTKMVTGGSRRIDTVSTDATDASMSMSRSDSTTSSLPAASSNASSSLPATGTVPSLADVIYNGRLRDATAKRDEANRKLRATTGTEQLIADYEQTVDIQAAANKHRKNIESVWKSRRVMAETMVLHQDTFWETMDSTDDYFKKKKAAQKAEKAMRVAAKELKRHQAEQKRLAGRPRAESDGSGSSD